MEAIGKSRPGLAPEIFASFTQSIWYLQSRIEPFNHADISTESLGLTTSEEEQTLTDLLSSWSYRSFSFDRTARPPTQTPRTPSPMTPLPPSTTSINTSQAANSYTPFQRY